MNPGGGLGERGPAARRGPGSWPWAGLWRLAVLACAGWMLHFAAHRMERSVPGASAPRISVEQVRRHLGSAVRLLPRDVERGGHRVLDASGDTVGYVLTTSPEADEIIGYSGPNRVLVVLDSAGAVAGVELLQSGDTPAHVDEVRRATSFWTGFLGWNPARDAMPRPAAVSGSTLTSLGIAEAVERRLAGRAPSLRFPDAVTLEEIRALVPGAARLELDVPRPGWIRVHDPEGRMLGHAVRTSPEAGMVRGYSGPTEALAWVEADGRTVGAVRLRRSYDTPEYVERVREDEGFLRQLAGRTVEEWAALDLKAAGFEGVSGATATSYAVAEGLRRRWVAEIEADRREREERPGWIRGRARDGVLLGVLVGSGVMMAGGFRGNARVRRVWQVVLVGVFGLGCGDLVSLALLAGWAGHGVAWRTAPALVLLAAMALLVPWVAGRALYCQQLCPHGAAQELLGTVRRWRVSVPERMGRWLEALPWVLLGVALLLPLAGVPINLAALEPFDAWTFTPAAVASVILAVLGLGASVFVPMAYCRYGCPTGALLRFLRDGRTSTRWERRDGVAAALVGLGAALLLLRPGEAGSGWGASAPAETTLAGQAFGTTWSVKIRGAVPDPAGLEGELAGELERIESTFSHWRPKSLTAQFNAAATTLPMEMSGEWIDLLVRALEISRASGGAMDPTVGPLVRAWGFGPGPAPSAAPTAVELEAMRSRTGWQRVRPDIRDLTVAKEHPGLELDLGALLQGYAADRLGERLRAAGYAEFLIEVGGELLAGGEWRVAVEDPFQPGRVVCPVVLRDAALATSGTYRTRREAGDRVRSHVIDPRSGAPVTHDLVLVSVVHPSCMEADAWATALLVRGDRADGSTMAGPGAAVLTVTGTPELHRVDATPGFPRG